jgi:uncharacterized protein (DUF58 family)
MRPIQLSFVALVTAILGIGTGWKPFFILTYLLIAALIFSTAWQAMAIRGLTFNRSSLGGRAQVGERVEERLALENHSLFPKLWVQVHDGSTLPGHHAGYVSSIGPRQRIAWRARTLCRARGRYTIGPVTATTGDPLGLYRREVTLAPENELIVLPPVLPLTHFGLYPGSMPGRGRGSQRSLQTSTNVVTVRNYIAGDPLTRIHWPSTARLGQFMVKEFDLDPTIDVVVLLDLDREAQAGVGDSSTEEYGVTIASSVAGHLLRQQELAVGLAVSGSSDVSLPLDRGERQLDRILEMLAVSHATRDAPLIEALANEETRLQRNTILVIITPSTALDWPQGVHYLQRRGVRPFVILLDPHSFNEDLGDNQRTHEALVAAGVPVIAVRRGDPLVHVLEQGPQ